MLTSPLRNIQLQRQMARASQPTATQGRTARAMAKCSKVAEGGLPKVGTGEGFLGAGTAELDRERGMGFRSGEKMMREQEAESPSVSKAQEGFRESQLECAGEQRDGLCGQDRLLGARRPCWRF